MKKNCIRRANTRCGEGRENIQASKTTSASPPINNSSHGRPLYLLEIRKNLPGLRGIEEEERWEEEEEEEEREEEIEEEEEGVGEGAEDTMITERKKKKNWGKKKIWIKKTKTKKKQKVLMNFGLFMH